MNILRHTTLFGHANLFRDLLGFPVFFFAKKTGSCTKREKHVFFRKNRLRGIDKNIQLLYCTA